jgi:hypothetical protein
MTKKTGSKEVNNMQGISRKCAKIKHATDK